MAGEEGNVLWKKRDGNVTDTSDTWDDTELIKAYDKAVAELKQDDQSHVSNCEPSEDNDTKQKKKKKKSRDMTRKWKAGGQCLAIYSADGLYYEATILCANYDSHSVEVKFAYYGNEEEVDMNNLLPMESKSELSIVPNSSNYINGGQQQMSSDDTRTSNNEKSSLKNNWRVSDICYVLNKNGDYQQAVINSFKSSDVCHVTIIKSNKKKEVRISQLRSSLPSEHKKSRKNSSCRCYSSEVNGFHPDIPMYIPPPPPTLQPNSGIPNPASMHTFSPWQRSENNSYNKNGMSCNIPKCPPLPVMPEEVISGNEEALANMLMSWYISGFHTGYYQGMRKSSSSSKNNFLEYNNQQRGGEVKKGNSRRWDNTLV